MIANKGRYFYTFSPKLRRPPRPLNDSSSNLDIEINCSGEVRNSRLNLHRGQIQALEKLEKTDKIQLMRLKFELAAAKQEIISLKKALSITNHQSSYQMKSMEEEIHILLEKNRNYEAQNIKLKEIIKFKEIQVLSKQSKSLLQFQKLNREEILNHKQNDSYLSNIDVKRYHQLKKPFKQSSQEQLIRAIGQMYQKFNGQKYKSLNQLWKWLKSSICRLDRMRKWRKEARQALKIGEDSSRAQLVTLLKDAVIFIN